MPDKINDKFSEYFENNVFDPENSEQKKIVQKRIDTMMRAPLMVKWLKESTWFNKDEALTFEVIKYLISCATAFLTEKNFNEKINFNSKEWINGLDMRLSNIKPKN